MVTSKLKLEDGLRIGHLILGPLVYYVQDHPLYLTTSMGYLQQGRLREVTCDCGETKLISEASLATGRIKSCGCLRASIRAKSINDKTKRMSLRADKKYVLSQIKIEQTRLRALQMEPIYTRDELAIKDCGTLLRNLIARKALLTRQANKLESRHECK